LLPCNSRTVAAAAAAAAAAQGQQVTECRMLQISQTYAVFGLYILKSS